MAWSVLANRSCHILKFPGSFSKKKVALLASLYFSGQADSVRAFSVTNKDQTRNENSKKGMSPIPDVKSAQAWCCTASLDPLNQKTVITSISGDENAEGPFQSMEGIKYDITVSSDWMEFIEVKEKRGNDKGGAGAYDTMRCDLMVRQPSRGEVSWKIWGKSYHLERLEKSFASLLGARTQGISDVAIDTAKEESDMLIRALMEEAESSNYMKEQGSALLKEDTNKEHTWIQLVKLTLLWSLRKGDSLTESEIVVRGHACSSSKPVPVFQAVQPIVATLAALGHAHDKEEAIIDISLPTRFQNPQSKVASWCKQRKKMDNPDTYKPPGVSEVLMVRFNASLGPVPPSSSDTPFSSLELLEGLSSNVFVIYKDGTLRTAQEGVLYGYVRHLVLHSAEECGLTVDLSKPVCLQDGIDGQWAEVFITSSSRLIWPISRILMPSGEGPHHGMKQCEIDGFSEFWCDPVLNSPRVHLATPRWQDILDNILQKAGYSR